MCAVVFVLPFSPHLCVQGTFLVVQAAAKAMMEEKLNGSIVNISSIVAKCGNIGQTNYSASKGGVISLTKSCALELSRFGIRCNVILPGFIQTDMTEGIPKEIKDQVMGMVPLGRMGQPKEIAEVCLFLASDKSSYITGSSVEVTGGLSL
jgi:17beta-estradiol 17-dehydrogenase/3alpha(17beta)-hydroxysteroid dehydrogenase (NAD+)